MRNFLTSSLVLAALTASGAAFAQPEEPAAPANPDAPAAGAETPTVDAPAVDTPAPEPPVADPPMPDPPAQPDPPADTALPPVTTAQTDTPAVEAPEAEDTGSSPTAWFRIDNDALGLQLWAGANNQVGPLDVATDIYVVDTFGEFDIGLAFSIDSINLSLLPMVGIGFDWSQQKLATLIIPQLYTIYDGPVYFEQWIQGFLNSPSNAGGGNTLYFRNFLLAKATDDFHVGAQAEFTLGLNDEACGGDTLCSLPVGGRINYNALGDWEALIGLFLGYETQDSARVDDGTSDPDDGSESDGIVGRITYLHTFE